MAIDNDDDDDGLVSGEAKICLGFLFDFAVGWRGVFFLPVRDSIWMSAGMEEGWLDIRFDET